ncbi:MAG: cold-shock protein [Pseudohongiellaceae bacterium]|nr:cold-shock protein [Pseudohongiellaceae bacterium]
MSNISQSLIIAIVLTLIVFALTYFINIQVTSAVLLGMCFIVSLASSLLASRPQKKRSKKRPDDKNRTPYNNAQRESGNVKWFNASKGFGFITRDSGDDIFVHFRSIRGEGHRVLHDGQRVEFAISEGDKGLQAEDVAAAN